MPYTDKLGTSIQIDADPTLDRAAKPARWSGNCGKLVSDWGQTPIHLAGLLVFLRFKRYRIYLIRKRPDSIPAPFFLNKPGTFWQALFFVIGDYGDSRSFSRITE